MADRLAFGILSTGNIARQFAAGVAGAHYARVVAVASRDADSARAFAAAHQISKSYGAYQALLDDDAVQAVYVALPNSMHHEWTLKALAAGKHVLCEKPIAVNARQAQEMFDAAAAAGLLLVEAFMYLSHPQTARIVEQVRGGAIGQLRLMRTSFCYYTTRIDGNIRFDKSLAGGALMDVGCYCLSLCRLIADAEPQFIAALGRLLPGGVDEATAGLMKFPGDVMATFSCGMRVQADNTAYLCGTDGYLAIPWPWKPQQIGATWSLQRSIPPRQDMKNGQDAKLGNTSKAAPVAPPTESFTADAPVPLYALEADDFALAVLAGAEPAMTAKQSLGNMRALDEIRRQIGLAFASDAM
jgi:predicted dehydrogenase